MMATFTAIKNKTQSGSALARTLDYVKQEKKTLWEEGQLVSGWNCVAQSAYDEMMTTKRRHGKADGRMFYQFVQSFDPAEAVTPQEVHAIGLELAQKLFPEFEVVVATHVDANHLHNHLIVNSVSCQTGCKLHQNTADLQRQRQVINTIDLCMRRAKRREDFIREMERQGYRVRWEPTRQCITYTTPKGKKCRDNRLHKDKYRKEVLEREFRIREAILYRRIEEAQSTARATDDAHSHLSHPGTVGASAGHPERPIPSAGGHGFYYGGNGDTGREADRGSSGGPSAAPTGWEKERAAAFSAKNTPAHAYAHVAVDHPDPSRVIRTVASLGHALEHDQAPAPSAPVDRHGDRKVLSRERKKKITMGHKADDHEEQQPWQQKM